jgi:hypothetical protein
MLVHGWVREWSAGMPTLRGGTGVDGKHGPYFLPRRVRWIFDDRSPIEFRAWPLSFFHLIVLSDGTHSSLF